MRQTHYYIYYLIALGMITMLTATPSMANVTVNTTLKEVNVWWNTSLAYLLEAGETLGSSFAYSVQSNYSMDAGEPSLGQSLANTSLSWAGQICANLSGTIQCYELNGSYKPPVTTVTETATRTVTSIRTITYTAEGTTYTRVVTETFTLATGIEQPQEKDNTWLLGAGILALFILILLRGMRR